MGFFDYFFLILTCATLLGVILLFAWAYDRLTPKHQDATSTAPMVPAPQWLQSMVRTEYVDVGYQLIRCVGQQLSSLGLARPGDLALHMPADNCLVTPKGKTAVVFRYVFDRGIDMSNGAKMNLDRLPLSTVAPDAIRRKLASSFPNYCRVAGLGEYHVLSVTDIPDGKVCVEILRG